MKDNPLFKSLIKNGLYAGAILAAYFILLYLVNLNFLQYNLITFLVMAVALFIFSFMSISEARKNMPDNRIKFLHAWIAAAFVFFIGLYVFGIAKLLIFFVIDPSYLNGSIDELILKLKEYADQIPNPEEAAEGMNKMKDPMVFVQQILIYYTAKSIILGALVALVAKKKNRLEETI
ncbi:MAG: DUF4199 domain-containing protein [Bacteroidales bacterium]|nr:DUF4199 domain-containing protein [Bacteroidales bacterium]